MYFRCWFWRPSIHLLSVYSSLRRSQSAAPHRGDLVLPQLSLMQLFIRNVAFAANEDDLKQALAQRLHRPPFDTDTPINFHVALFRAPRSNTHRGMGLLTLPTTDAGEIFLHIYGISGINLNGRVAAFSRSRNPLDTALIESVRNTPWQDPRRIREEKARREEQSTSIKLSKFSFGRVCRDGVFSPEVSYKGTVACNMETRRLDIKCIDAAQDDLDHSDDSNSVGLNFSRLFRVQTIRFSETSMHLNGRRVVTFVVSGLNVFLQSDLPPAFERRPAGMMAAVLDLSGKEQMADRVTAFDDDDLALSTMTSQTLCLEFGTDRDLDTFLRRCSAIHFPRDTHRDVRVEERRCYDAANMDKLQILLRSLHFSLAFEVDKAVWAGILDPPEVLALEDALKQLQRDTASTETAPIFRHFIGSLEVPTVGSASVPRPKKRRRRNKKPLPDPPVADLRQRLAHAVNVYIEELNRQNKYVPYGGIYESYHVLLTPSTQILEGPLPDQSNSVLRRFQSNDSFLRVSFQDENRSPPRQDQTLRVSIDHLLENRYKKCLNDGIRVAGRQYEFVGYSMSGLKIYSFIFVAPFEFEGIAMNAESIRSRLGDFSKVIYQPAMLGARWSQAFSSSDPSVTLEKDQILFVEDKVSGTGSVFSDGCSSISMSLNRDVWKTQRRSQKIIFPPSAIQFRCAGAKGVLVANPDVTSVAEGTLHFRPSQRKFVTDDVRTLDIAATSAKPILTYLNRPLIAMLEHHGVPRDSFMNLQRSAISEVHQMKDSLRQASKIFSQHGLGNSFRLQSLFNNIRNHLKLEIGDRSNRDLFHHQLIKTTIAFATMHILREIKHRGHILIPGSYTLIGVVDEWDVLDEGEIYATVVDDRNNVNIAIEGRVLLTRSPQIHPGDVQFVSAVRKPQLAHLTNVVVFSCKGPRSLPSMLGGGDLDGDIYNLILDETLYPPKGYTAEPGEYAAIPPKTTPEPCTVKDVVDFVIDYIKSDLVGIISVLHLRIGDLKEYDCDECLKLAEKASHAVDFQKRGVPVSFKDLPKAPSNLKPDYLSGEGVNPSEAMGDRYYPSKKVLGELYRNVPLEDYRPSEADLELQRMDGEKIYSALQAVGLRRLGLPSVDMVVPEELMEEMDQNLQEYSERLMEIAKTHTISKRANAYLSEAELVSGTIQERYPDHRKRREAMVAMNFQTEQLAKGIRYEFQSPEYRPLADGEEQDDDWEDWEEIAGDEERRADRFTRAWAAWQVAEEALDEDPSYFGASSFGLLALGTLLDVVKESKNSL